MVRENSRKAYESIRKTLPKSQRTVFAAVCRRKKGITRQGLADSLNRPINEITGRVRELLDADLILEEGHCQKSGRKRALLVAAPLDEKIQGA